MNETILNCDMAQDLIPLCSEGLCSDASRAAVEAHLQTCENCRRLASALPNPLPAAVPVPDETSTFRKVTRRIRKSRILNRILTAALLMLAIPVIVLSVGSILRDEETPGFETVIQSIQVRRLAKAIGEGNFEPYLNVLHTRLIAYPDFDTASDEKLYAKELKMLNDTYAEAIGSRKLSSVRVQSEYWETGLGVDVNYRPTTVNSTAVLTYDDGTKISLTFYRDEYGNYICVGYGGGDVPVNSEAEEKLGEALGWIAENKSSHMPFVEQLFENPVVSDSRLDMMRNRFAPEYRETLLKSFTEFTEKYRFTDMTVSDTKFDKERAEFYYEFTLTAADDKGSAVMHSRFYDSRGGLLPPEPDEIEILSAGCTPELTEALTGLFEQ